MGKELEEIETVARKESETWQQNDKYKFWLLGKFKEVFPDKEVKTDMVHVKGLGLREGVWVRVNPEGVYDFENITAQTAERVIQLDNGEDVLSSNQHDMKFTAAASSLGGAAASANAIDPLDQVLAQVAPGAPQEKQQLTKESAEKLVDSDSDSSSSDDEKVASKLHKPKAKSKSKPSAKSKACSSTAGAQPMANANAQPKTKIARAGSGGSLSVSGSTHSAPTVAGESAPPASVPKGANAKSQHSKKHQDPGSSRPVSTDTNVVASQVQVDGRVTRCRNNLQEQLTSLRPKWKLCVVQALQPLWNMTIFLE